MVRIYTLTLAPSLDSATITPQIYPEGKLRCTAPVFEPRGGGINVATGLARIYMYMWSQQASSTGLSCPARH